MKKVIALLFLVSSSALAQMSGTDVNVLSSVLPDGASTESTFSSFKSANHTDLLGISSTLGSPFQAGGSIGNTAFQCNAGTNLNTSALALDASVGTTNTRLSTINTTLGSPFQAGGSIGNSSFGISGTLPAFASTPTVNLGTISTAATAALQTTGNSSLSAIDAGIPAALGQTTMSASMPVTISSDQTLPPTKYTTGTLTGTNQVDIDINGYSLLILELAFISPSGGNIELHGSVDGTNFFGEVISGYSMINNDLVDVIDDSLAPSFSVRFNVAGYKKIRINSFDLATVLTYKTGVGAVNTIIDGINGYVFTYSRLRDGSGTNLTSTLVGSNQSLDVNVAQSALPSGASTSSLQTTANTKLDTLITSTGTVNTSIGSTNTKLDTLHTDLGTTIHGDVASLSLAQGANTSGQTGVLVQGAVTTAAPSYTTAKSNPLSLNTTGDLRVALAALPALAAGSAVIGHVINDASSAVIGHVIADSGSTTAVTGTVTANATLQAGTALAGLFELADSSGTKITAANPSENNITKINGVVPLMGNGTTGTGSQRVTIASDNTAFTVNAAESGTWTVQPGNTANTTPWLASVNDGTNTAKVQAASVAPVAADKALTVAQSPNGLNPCQNPSAALVSISGATAGTAAVQLVALSGTTKIYVCAMSIIGVSGTTPTFSLVQGTGSNCATGQTVVVSSWTTAAGTLYPFVAPTAVGAAGNALCYLDTGTTPIQRYTISYVQQ